MKKKQKSIVVVADCWNDNDGDLCWDDNTEELNKLLDEGWVVVSSNPMGGYGCATGEGQGSYFMHGFASLVILEKEED